MQKMKSNKYLDIDFAKLDIDRLKRRGYPEAVFCQSKSNQELVEIFKNLYSTKQNIIGTRADKEQFNLIKEIIPDACYDEKAGVITIIQNKIDKIGEVAICTAGTGDIPVAQEAKVTAEFFGSKTKTYYDIGIAGIHRLLENIDDIGKANVIIAIAGMDGALPGVIAGLVDTHVIAVPTSVGYGANLNGISALLTMLNTCVEGISIVNIDNGFNAGYSANQINRKIAKGK